MNPDTAPASVFKKVVKMLFKLDNIAHIAIALILLALCFIVLVKAIFNLSDISHDSIIGAINDVLLAFIIAELLWPVLRFLKKEEFSLNPFLFVGIMSSTRRLLFIEAKSSIASNHDYSTVIEIGVNTFTILILIVVYYIYQKTRSEAVSNKPE